MLPCQPSEAEQKVEFVKLFKIEVNEDQVLFEKKKTHSAGFLSPF